MPFSPSPAGSPTAGAPPPPPPPPLPLAAPPVVSTSPWEPHPAKEAGPVVAPAAAAAAALEAMPRLPSEDNHSETENLEHEKKVKKYQSVLAARLKAKYFSSKAFEKAGDVFEEIVIQSETIRSSRWPFTRSFADPAKFCEEKSYIEHIYPSVAGEDMSRNMHII